MTIGKYTARSSLVVHGCVQPRCRCQKIVSVYYCSFALHVFDYARGRCNCNRMATTEIASLATDFTDDDDQFSKMVKERETIRIGNRILPKLNWTYLKHKGEDQDCRRLVEHRERNCHCEVCIREMNKLPPDEPLREKYAARKLKKEDRERKQVKRKARKEVKAGKQACIRNFFRY
jgi:hypothetical protein